MSRTRRSRNRRPSPRMTRSPSLGSYTGPSREGTGTGGNWRSADLAIVGGSWNPGQIGHGGAPAVRARKRVIKIARRRADRRRRNASVSE